MYDVEVYFDENGVYGGQEGCYRARLKNNHGIHDAGRTPEEAFGALIITAASHGYSANRSDYRRVVFAPSDDARPIQPGQITDATTLMVGQKIRLIMPELAGPGHTVPVVLLEVMSPAYDNNGVQVIDIREAAGGETNQWSLSSLGLMRSLQGKGPWLQSYIIPA